MAFFTIEDRAGEIECLAFPAQFTRYGHLIRVDAPLYIKGNLSLRDGEEETPKILVSEITEILDNSRAEAIVTTPVRQEAKPRVRIDAEKTGESASAYTETNPPAKIFLSVPARESAEFKKAQNLVELFEGNTKVIFYDSASASYFPSQSGIAFSAFVHRELVSLLGESNVVLK